MKKQYLPFLVCSSVFVFSNQVSAVSLDYAVEAGISASNNINRASDDPAAADPIKDEVLLMLGELNVLDNSSKNDFKLGMDVRYLNYVGDSFEDDTRANIDLESRWGIVDESFSWVVNGYYGQVAIDAFTVETPDNLQNIGVVETGPDLTIEFNDVNSLILGYKYADFYAEITDADYQSNLYSLSLERRLRPTLTLSLNSSYEEIDYEDNTTAQDFDEARYFLALASRTATSLSALELGQIKLEFDDNSDLDNEFKQFTFLRQLNSRNTVDLQLLETIDTGVRDINRETAATVFITNDLFVNKQAKIGYDYNRTDLQIGLDIFYIDQDYIRDDNLDRIIRTANMYITYGTPVSLQVGFGYTYFEQDFYITNQLDQDDVFNLRFEKRLGSHLSAVFLVENYNRETRTLTDTFNIEETKYILTLRYADKI